MSPYYNSWFLGRRVEFNIMMRNQELSCRGVDDLLPWTSSWEGGAPWHICIRTVTQLWPLCISAHMNFWISVWTHIIMITNVNYIRLHFFGIFCICPNLGLHLINTSCISWLYNLNSGKHNQEFIQIPLLLNENHIIFQWWGMVTVIYKLFKVSVITKIKVVLIGKV